MKRAILLVAVVALVGLSGCAGFLGTDGSELDGNGTIDVEDADPGATNVNQTLRAGINDSIAGSEWTATGATYPRDEFTVDAAQHENISLGVDTDGDDEVDREFNETHISGVNNNAYSFDITLDTDYTLEEGDTVMVQYPAIDNPSEAGEYEVEIRVNDQQVSTSPLTIE